LITFRNVGAKIHTAVCLTAVALGLYGHTLAWTLGVVARSFPDAAVNRGVGLLFIGRIAWRLGDEIGRELPR
jgi:hypothetical protein